MGQCKDESSLLLTFLPCIELDTFLLVVIICIHRTLSTGPNIVKLPERHDFHVMLSCNGQLQLCYPYPFSKIY